MIIKTLILLTTFSMSLNSFAYGVKCKTQTTKNNSKVKLTAIEQLNILWGSILAERYDQLPPLNGKEKVLELNPLKTVSYAMTLREKAFDAKGDIRQTEATKATHIHGPAAVAKFVIHDNSPFTGLLSGGSHNVLIRASMAFSPAKGAKKHNFPQPGLAIKLFTDNSPSRNILAMGSLDGEGTNAKYFSTPMNTKLKRPVSLKAKIGAWVFGQSTIQPNFLKLNHLVEKTSTGQDVNSPRMPDWISFVPTEAAKSFGNKNDLDFRDALLSIPEGTQIYKILGYMESGKIIDVFELGYVTTETKFTPSYFADRKLHFRHSGAPPTRAYEKHSE